jgi:hypothetical protein
MTSKKLSANLHKMLLKAGKEKALHQNTPGCIAIFVVLNALSDSYATNDLIAIFVNC